MTATKRLKRSLVYATAAVAASTAAVLILVLVGHRVPLHTVSARIIDTAGYVLGFPLLLGWAVSTAIFGPLSSVTPMQNITAVFLTPVISIPIDASLIFGVSEFLHRRASRGPGPDQVVHIK